MRSLFVPFLATLLAAAGACSATGGGNQFTTSGSGGAAGGNGTGGEVNLGGGFVGTGGGSGGDGCSEAAKLVYVLSTDGDIWSFAPDKKQFTNLFPLSCPTPNDGNDWQPNSMAVDRNAVAYVNYVGSDTFFGGDVAGKIFKVDTQKKTCEATNIQLPNGWYRLGMGFSTDTANGEAETLFLTGTGTISSPGLGHVDLGSGTVVTTPGPFNGDPALDGENAELTGTGDAKLFGFFTTSPWPRVAEIEKATAKILSDDVVNGVPTPLSWAFSFWGGAFYLYTSADGTSPSTVTRFDPATHSVDSAYNLFAPMTIVGAGVSTCAPLKPPA